MGSGQMLQTRSHMAINQYPIPISRLGHRYFVYNVDHVSLLRRDQNIPGTLIGTLPQSPQQNTFLGLPLELLSEEARLLVEKGVAYILDDSEHHRKGLRHLSARDRERYMRSLDAQGREFENAAADLALAKKEQALKKLPENKRERLQKAIESEKLKRQDQIDTDIPNSSHEEDDPSESLFSSSAETKPLAALNEPDATASDASFDTLGVSRSWAQMFSRRAYNVTPTVSDPPFPTPDPSSEEHYSHSNDESHGASPVDTTSLQQYGRPSSPPPVPSFSSYCLFKHLHSQSYFLSSGLRFGARYSVYPGDPLRFHAHFLARGYDWDEDIDLLSLVGGGRLGTGVKKGYLIGGPTTDQLESDSSAASGGVGVEHNLDGRYSESEKENGTDFPVRCFCVEWAGM